jgi:branched-chain amino acid transport system substrate-binding protein
MGRRIFILSKSIKFVILAFAFIVALTLIPAAGFSQVKFGSTLTLTGSGASFGQNAHDGMELARLEINEAGGINGQKLEIVYEDFGETDLKKAVSAAQKLISIDNVNVILPMVTEDAEVIWPIAHRKNIITMAIYAGARELTRGRPLIFQVSSSDEVLARTLVDHAANKGMKSACILAEQSPYFISVAKFAGDYWLTKTNNKPTVVEYNPDTSDFRQLLLKMRSLDCQAVFLFTSTNRQGTVLKQMTEMKWDVLKLGLDISDDPNILKIAGIGAENLVYAKYTIGTQNFRAKFKAHYGKEAGVPSALAYDAVKLLSEVIKQVGLDTLKINEALKAIQNFSGASGKITFDPDGTRHDREAGLWLIEHGSSREISQ